MGNNDDFFAEITGRIKEPMITIYYNFILVTFCVFLASSLKAISVLHVIAIPDRDNRYLFNNMAYQFDILYKEIRLHRVIYSVNDIYIYKVLEL